MDNYWSLVLVAVVVLAAGPFTVAVTTGAQTPNETATASPTPTATTTPTKAVSQTPSTATAEPTNGSATTESTENGEVDPEVVIEQWDDRIQVVVLLEDVPDNVESIEVRGATMTRELQVTDSPPAGQGSLAKPATIEVLIIYEDGSESVIHAETFS